MDIQIYFGDHLQNVKLPEGWRLNDSKPLTDAGPALQDLDVLIRQALENPLGQDTLKNKLASGSKVTIISDDGARPTPVKSMLKILLEELRAAGVPNENIDILIGLGTHGTMTQEALAAKLSADVLSSFRVSQHDCRAADLVPITKLDSGCPVRINPLVAKADLSIGLGTIIPHVMNGYGGGPKIIFPAVSNYEAIREHHLAWTAHKGSIFGSMQDNHFYQDMLKIVEKSPLTYSLNSLTDLQNQVAAVLFGSWQKVCKQGAEISQRLCGVRYPGKADVTLVSGYPYDESLQLMKPLTTGGLLTKPGGTVILTAKAKSDFPPFFHEVFGRVQRESGGDLKKYALNCFHSGTLLLENAPVDLNCALFYALVGRNDFRVALISTDFDNAALENIGFVVYGGLEEALAAESKRNPKAQVNLVSLAGTLPILPEGIGLDI